MNAVAAQGAQAKAKLFRGLADPSRLSVLEALRDGARNVAELVDATGLTQPGVSNHLSCLLDCGLVVREPRGRFAYYALSDERVEALLQGAELLLEGSAAGVLSCPRCATRERAEDLESHSCNER
jgi:ArsR family transcriptional regulator, cadmium/lead-responsive transcriptional repressor